jgi:hypothetical protein
MTDDVAEVEEGVEKAPTAGAGAATPPPEVKAVAPVSGVLEKTGIRKAEFTLKSDKLDAAAKAYNDAHTAAESAVSSLPQHAAFTDAYNKCAELAEFEEKTGQWKLKSGASQSDFQKLQQAFDDAKGKLNNAVLFDSTEVPALKALREAKQKLSAFTNPVWGKVKAIGLGEAVKDNLSFFSENARKGRGLEMSARGAGLGASLYCGYEAIKGQDAEGNDRSTNDRLLWLAGAVGIAGLAIAAGAAR